METPLGFIWKPQYIYYPCGTLVLPTRQRYMVGRIMDNARRVSPYPCNLLVYPPWRNNRNHLYSTIWCTQSRSTS